MSLDISISPSQVTLSAGGVAPSTSELALTAHRFADGTAPTLATFGIPLPAGWLTPAEVNSLALVAPDGALHPMDVRQHVAPSDQDGSLMAVEVQADVGTMTARTPVTGWKLRKGVSNPPRRNARVGLAWTLNISQAAVTARLTNGAPEGVLVPDVATRLASRTFGTLPSLEQIRGLGGQYEMWVTRMETFAPGMWDHTYVVPHRWGEPQGQTLAWGYSGLWDEQDAPLPYPYPSYDDGLISFNYYDRANAFIEFWAMGGDIEFLRRGLVIGWHFLKRLLADKTSTGQTLSFHNQQPDGVFKHYVLTGCEDARKSLLWLGRFAHDNFVNWSYNTYDPVASEQPDITGKITGRSADGRVFARSAVSLAQCAAIGDTEQPWQTTLEALLDIAWQSGPNRAYIDNGDHSFWPISWCNGDPNTGSYSVDTFYFPLVAGHFDRVFELMGPLGTREATTRQHLIKLANYNWMRRVVDNGRTGIASDWGVIFFGEPDGQGGVLNGYGSCGGMDPNHDISLTMAAVFAIAGKTDPAQMARFDTVFVSGSGGEGATWVHANEAMYYYKQSNQQNVFTPRALGAKLGL